MASYFDASGRRLSLGPEINRGGEGAVFELVGDTTRIAKIYHKPAPPAKAEKLRAMTGLASPELIKFASWPLELLHNGNPSEIAGVVMPRVSRHEEIHTLYSPAQRKNDYPDKDWAFLVHTARNCSVAFHAVHQKPLVIGDVNPGNLLVSQQGTVFLIDCDSFQIALSNKLFLCEVGVKEFTPPELQQSKFTEVRRTHNHDRFGLALMIFHLLFMGRHPYAGRFSGTGDMPIERAIKEYRFAFGANAARFQMSRPPQTLSVEQVAPEVTTLFERAFGLGSDRADARPSAMEWYKTLGDLLDGLKRCHDDRGHKFSGRLTKCPWCELVQDGAPNYFFSVTLQLGVALLKPDASIAAVWTTISTMQPPSGRAISNVLHTPVTTVPTPLPDDLESNQALARMVQVVALGALATSVLGIIVPFIAAIGIPICVVFASWWLCLYAMSPRRAELARRKEKLRRARTELHAIEAAWKAGNVNAVSQFDRIRKELSSIHDQLLGLGKQHDQELKKIQDTLEERQRAAFLQRQLLFNATIDGIGAGRKATLSSYGIETAFDIDHARILDIPGFGDVLASTLVNWRTMVEQQFRFDPRSGVPASDRQALLSRYAQLRQHYEAALRRGVDRLKGTHSDLDKYLSQFREPARQAHAAMLQCAADVALARMN